MFFSFIFPSNPIIIFIIYLGLALAMEKTASTQIHSVSLLLPEYEFLNIKYSNLDIAWNQLDQTSIEVLQSTTLAAEWNGNSSAFPDITRLNENSVIVAKLFKASELTSFLEQIGKAFKVIKAAVGFLPSHIYHSLATYLSYTKDFDLTSNSYFCFCDSSQLQLMSINKILTNLTECMELYSIKERTFLKPINFQVLLPQEERLHDIIENKMARRNGLINSSIVATAVNYTYSKNLNSFEEIPRAENDTTKYIKLQYGAEVEIYRCLRDLLGFGEIVIQSDGFLSKGSKSTLSNKGLAHSINSGKADISISLAELLPYRMNGQFGIRFLHPSFQSPVSAFFVQPKVHQVRNIFFMPFSLELWLAIGVFGLICSCVIFMMTIRPNESPDALSIRVISDCNVLQVLEKIRQRGYHQLSSQPNFQSTKIILITIMIAGQIFYAGYTYEMYSILYYPTFPIKRFDNLFDVSFTMYIDTFVPTLWNRVLWMQEQNFIQSTTQNIEATKSVTIPLLLSSPSPSALLTTSEEFFAAFQQLNITDEVVACAKIHQVSIPETYAMQGMFVKKGSPFRDHFNSKLLLIRERGLGNRYEQNYFRDSTLRCLDMNRLTFRSIGNQDMGTAFVFLFAALAFSIFILVLEFSNEWRTTAICIVNKSIT